MKFSLNNHLILEPYVKRGLEAKREGGIATPGQKDNLEGLKLLIDFHLPDGFVIPAGAIAFIKEETLHTHGWASKILTSPYIEGKFIIAEFSCVEGFSVADSNK